jgi:hypothetical protein
MNPILTLKGKVVLYSCAPEHMVTKLLDFPDMVVLIMSMLESSINMRTVLEFECPLRREGYGQKDIHPDNLIQ